jgi:hypothetical protein
LTYLQFVDDTLLLGKPTVQEARAIKKALDVFLSASGMQLNLDKSHIFFFNTLNIIQQRITRILGFQRSSLPSRYLGAPLIDKAIRNTGWQEMLTKLENMLSCWTHRFLSLSGRILLIKSILMAMIGLFVLSFGNTRVHLSENSLNPEKLPMGRNKKRKQMGSSHLGKNV